MQRSRCPRAGATLNVARGGQTPLRAAIEARAVGCAALLVEQDGALSLTDSAELGAWAKVLGST